jgi:hypothetical protein
MSVEFTIQGLNAQQRVLADIIWACRDFAGVQKFIKALPTQALRDEACSIVELMKMAAIEQCYDGVNQEMEEADSVLRKYNTKRG